MIATKQGRIFTPNHNEWAQCPVVDDMGDKWRVYFSNRNKDGCSYITFIDVAPDEPGRILYNHKAPIASLGRAGAFDEHGMMPSSIVTVGSEKYLYYTGWKRLDVDGKRYENSVGVLRVRGNWFRRMLTEPVLARQDNEHFAAHMSSWIDRYGVHIGLYSSCIDWLDGEPTYDCKMAVSEDGLNWKNEKGSAVVLDGNEGGICSVRYFKDPACVSGNVIFCVRDKTDYRGGKGSYRIEHGIENFNGTIHRCGTMRGLYTGSPGEWDSEMMCYPYLFVSPNTGIKYLFYNGNNFGQSGIGYATIQ